jgi:hypothetical protein
MAAKSKAAKAKEPPFTEAPLVQIEVTTRSYKRLVMEVGPEGIRLGESPHDPEHVDIFWEALPNLLAALTRAQEIHAGVKTAELPLFGAQTSGDADDDLDDEEDDGDE